MKNMTIFSERFWRLLPGSAFVLLFITGLPSCHKESGQAAPELAITAFTPTEAAEGGTVVIRGRSFSLDASKNIVQFNGTMAAITGTPKENELTVTVPEGAATGRITVTINGKTVSSSTDFKVNPLAPVVTTLAPDKGDVGTEVTITGNCFTNTSKVFFAGVEATDVTFVSKTSIKAKVPAGALIGKVKVIANGLEALSPADFYVKPVVTAFSPDKAEEGTVIEITGTNFSTVIAENSVFFGSVAATEITEANATKLKVKVPAGAQNEKIKVVVKEMETLSAAAFLLLPTIISITPNHGARGSVVTITGKNMDANAEVLYSGTPVTSFEPGRSATSIQFKIPAGAVDGAITFKQSGNTYNLVNYLITNCWQPYFSTTISGLNDGAIQFAEGNKIVWGFGYTGGAGISNAMYSFDIATKNYIQLRFNDNSEPGPSQNGYPTYGAINGKAFIFSGGGWVYDVGANTFTTVNSGGYQEASSFVYNNQLHFYYVNGNNTGLIMRLNTDPLSPLYGIYTTISNSLPGNIHSAVEVIGDTAYIIGGRTSSTGNARSVIAVNMQDRNYNTIDLSAVMTHPISRRFLHFHKDNILYFGGGYENGTIGHSFYSLNLTTRQAKKLEDMPNSSTTVPSLYASGKAYMVGSNGAYYCRPE